MGGSSGSYNYSKGNGNGGGRGRSYGLMLVLAFGAALLGVMVLHKLRERRIFNLIIQEKDADLISLHLNLQKERDYAKELKRKNEEMKTKIYTIRTQKMELDRRILELKSTLGSLKEELKTMEGSLEEKHNEIKMLRVNTGNGSPQVMELLGSLKEKEAEIEDLKQRLESPVKVWSVSTDDPSNPPVNVTMSESVAGKERTVPVEDGHGNKSMSVGHGETTMEEGETDRREMMDKDGNNKHGSTEEEGGFGSGARESNLTNPAEAISNTNGKVNDHKESDAEEIRIAGNGHAENQKLNVAAKDGMKLAIQDDSASGERPRVRGRQGYTGGDTTRKWRLIAKNRRLERGNFKRNGVGSGRFFNDDSKGFTGREEEGAASNRRLTGDNHILEARDAVDPAKYLQLQNTEISEDFKNKLESTDADGKSEKMRSSDTEDFPEDLEVANAEEQEQDASDDNLFDEFGSNLEDDKEYREEIDESEFQ